MKKNNYIKQIFKKKALQPTVDTVIVVVHCASSELRSDGSNFLELYLIQVSILLFQTKPELTNLKSSIMLHFKC